MSGMFKSKKITPEPVPNAADDRLDKLFGEIEPYLSGSAKALGKPYEGQLIAKPTQTEKNVIGRLDSYLSNSTVNGGNIGLANDEIGRILQNNSPYDPFKEGGRADYVQGRLKKFLVEDALPAVRQGGALNQSYFGSSQLEREEQTTEDVMDQLAGYLYGLESEYQDKRFQAAQVAPQLENAPIQRLMAELGLAGYERSTFIQPELDATYQDYRGTANAFTTAAQFSGQGGALAYPTYEPSIYEKYIYPIQQAGIQATIGGLVGSSREFKYDIEPNKYDSEAIIQDLEIVNFKYDPEIVDDGRKEHIGVIIEDSHKLLKAGDGKHLSLMDAVGLLLDVAKKQSKRIEKLESKIGGQYHGAVHSITG